LFSWIQVVVIVSGGLIAFLNAAGVLAFPGPLTIIVSASLGATIAILTSFNQVFKFDKTSADYSKIWDTLQMEKYLFQNSAALYSNLDEAKRRTIFVERVENLLHPELGGSFFVSHSPSRSNDRL
jgi:Protein of unknown function (DUF4231)